MMRTVVGRKICSSCQIVTVRPGTTFGVDLWALAGNAMQAATRRMQPTVRRTITARSSTRDKTNSQLGRCCVSGERKGTYCHHHLHGSPPGEEPPDAQPRWQGRRSRCAGEKPQCGILASDPEGGALTPGRIGQFTQLAHCTSVNSPSHGQSWTWRHAFWYSPTRGMGTRCRGWRGATGRGGVADVVVWSFGRYDWPCLD